MKKDEDEDKEKIPVGPNRRLRLRVASTFFANAGAWIASISVTSLSEITDMQWCAGIFLIGHAVVRTAIEYTSVSYLEQVPAVVAVPTTEQIVRASAEGTAAGLASAVQGYPSQD